MFLYSLAIILCYTLFQLNFYMNTGKFRRDWQILDGEQCKGFEIRHVMLLKVFDGAISDPKGFRSNCQASSC